MSLPFWAASDKIYAKRLSGLGNIKKEIKRANTDTKSSPNPSCQTSQPYAVCKCEWRGRTSSENSVVRLSLSEKLTWFIFSVISGEGPCHKCYRIFFPWTGFLGSSQETTVKGQCPSPRQSMKITA